MDTQIGSTAIPDLAEAASAIEAWSAEVDPGDWELEILLNAPVLRSLMEDFARITCTATAILDLKGKVLVAVGWQDICTKYHRIHACTPRLAPRAISTWPATWSAAITWPTSARAASGMW